MARGLRRKTNTTRTTRHDRDQQRPLHVAAPRRGWWWCGRARWWCRCPAGIDCLQERQLRANAVHGLDDVGARLAEDDDDHGALAVQIAGGADVLHRVDHIGHVGEPHRRAVVIADDQRLVLVGLRDLVVGDDVRASRCRRRSGRAAQCEFCRLSTDCTLASVRPIAVQLGRDSPPRAPTAGRRRRRSPAPRPGSATASAP